MQCDCGVVAYGSHRQDMEIVSMEMHGMTLAVFIRHHHDDLNHLQHDIIYIKTRCNTPSSTLRPAATRHRLHQDPLQQYQQFVIDP